MFEKSPSSALMVMAMSPPSPTASSTVYSTVPMVTSPSWRICTSISTGSPFTHTVAFSTQVSPVAA